MHMTDPRLLRWLELVDAGCYWPGPHTIHGCTCSGGYYSRPAMAAERLERRRQREAEERARLEQRMRELGGTG